MIAFDDGYRDNYELAFPTLSAHGVPATFFLCTGFLDGTATSWWDEIAWLLRHSLLREIRLTPWLERPVRLGPLDREASIRAVLARYKTLPTQSAQEMVVALRERSGSPPLDPNSTDTLWLTWEMARAMAAGGMEIGGHTVNHPLLSRLDGTAQRAEITGGQRRITEELGRPATAFAYPVGSADAHDETTKVALAEAGYQLAFSFHGGYAREKNWDPFDIPRTHISNGTEESTLRAIMAVPQVVISPFRLPSLRPAARSLLGTG
jgi:peptidoglycan/xylan/chitin deacetylase (PgdA/CDA1 family)